MRGSECVESDFPYRECDSGSRELLLLIAIADIAESSKRKSWRRVARRVVVWIV